MKINKRNKNVGIGTTPHPILNFNIKDNGELYEIMRIEKGKFFWKGEEVQDTQKVYERFNDWLKLAEVKTLL